MQCWTRKEGTESRWILDGVWKLKGSKKKAHRGRCPFCLYEGDVKYDWIV